VVTLDCVVVCIRGTWGDRSQCYQGSLVVSWIRTKLYTYMVCSFDVADDLYCYVTLV